MIHIYSFTTEDMYFITICLENILHKNTQSIYEYSSSSQQNFSRGLPEDHNFQQNTHDWMELILHTVDHGSSVSLSSMASAYIKQVFALIDNLWSKFVFCCKLLLIKNLNGHDEIKLT